MLSMLIVIESFFFLCLENSFSNFFFFFFFFVFVISFFLNGVVEERQMFAPTVIRERHTHTHTHTHTDTYTRKIERKKERKTEKEREKHTHTHKEIEKEIEKEKGKRKRENLAMRAIGRGNGARKFTKAGATAGWGAKNGLRRMGSAAGGRSSEERRLSAEELIQLEHAHGAHNYHPLPVVLDEERAFGFGMWRGKSTMTFCLRILL